LIRDALFGQLELATEKDANPHRRGEGNELVSVLGGTFPEAGFLSGLSLPLDGDGWISGDFLREMGKLALEKGSGLVELLPSENRIFAIGLATDGASPEELFRGKPPRERELVSCPFWGPCLGANIRLLPPTLELMESLADPNRERGGKNENARGSGFKTCFSGCPRDCRGTLERSDLGVAHSADGTERKIRIGGRHAPFRPPVAPFVWRTLEASDDRGLKRLLKKARDFREDFREGEESLPELVNRLGAESLNDFADEIPGSRGRFRRPPENPRLP
jgi:dissimilatory sulfite reductase (desulfoviridin) alpha/beta subunit